MSSGLQFMPVQDEIMLLSSKYKQIYECRLPAQAVRFHQDRASEPHSQGYTRPSIPDLLKPMHTAPCLVKTKDWWTYEFYFGHASNYRVCFYLSTDTGVKGDVFFPGYFDSEFDWINETAKASKQHRLKRYHSQSYVNGRLKYDWCDSLTISLSTKQYMDYVKAQVSDTKRKILTGDEGTDGTADERTDEESATPTKAPDVLGSDTEGVTSEHQEDSNFWEGVTNPGGTTATDTLQTFGDETLNFKVITDPAGLMKFVQHLKEREALRKEKERRGAEDEDEEERLLLQEFDEEIAGLSVPSANIEEMKEEMQKEFDNIIDEAQQELDTEGLKGEFDRTQATQTLETTLDKLLNRLEDKEAGDTEAEHLTEGGQKANDPRLTTMFKSELLSIRRAAATDGEVEVQEMGEGDLQWQHIKDMVKEQLEKAGLKAEGRMPKKHMAYLSLFRLLSDHANLLSSIFGRVHIAKSLFAMQMN
uniref:Endoplasmic reticulum lectin n=1 Tax=Oncorhynchus kisutch TaxID=8019 RepID=A0A8C7CDW5_ONCKI